MKRRRRRQIRQALVAVIPVALLVACQLPFLWRLSGAWLPQWDMAKYGVSGLRLAGAIARLDALGFLRELNALSVWPPFFPLLEAPFFLAFGRGPEVAARLVTGLWAATLLLLPWALAPLSERRSPAPGWLAAAALAAGSLYGSFATLVMLEVPGLFLTVVALGFSLRAFRSEPNAWPKAYLAGTLLFFCKYNYGLLFLAPLLAFRLRLGFYGWGNLTAEALRRLHALRRSPWLYLGLAVLAGLVAIRLGGGFTFGLLGREVSVRSPGNPLLVLIWLGLLGILVSGKRRRAVAAALLAADRDLQGFLRFTAAPILVWLLAPPHLRDLLGFLENRSSELPFFSGASLLFYPRAYFAAIAPGPVCGAIVVLLALLGWRWLAGAEGESFLALWTLTGVVAAAIHPYKQDRFFLHAGAALAILAAATLSRLLERSPRLGRERPARSLAAGLVALLLAALWGQDQAAIRGDAETRSVPPAVAEVIDAVVAARREEPALLLGAWNLASPWLVEWRSWQAQPDGAWTAPPLPLRPEDLARGRDGELLAARLPAGPPLVLEIAPLAAEPAQRAETAWQEPAHSVLADPALYRPAPPRDFAAAGYRLRMWRRLGE